MTTNSPKRTSLADVLLLVIARWAWWQVLLVGVVLCWPALLALVVVAVHDHAMASTLGLAATVVGK